jgi:hypothetical protein
VTHRKTKKDIQIADGKEVGGGAESFAGETALASINHSVLSGESILGVKTE